MPSQFRVTCTALVALVAAVSSGAAAQSTAAPAPDGLRIFVTGHSFHVFLPPMLEELAAASGIEEHQQVGLQRLGGSTVLRHWDLPDSVNTAKPALIQGDVDVFTMSPVVAVPDEGIALFTALGLQHNPDLRLLIQASWIPGEQQLPVDLPERDRWLTDNSLRDDAPIDELWLAIDDFRSRIEAQVDQLNREHGKRALMIVPVGNAVLKLRESVQAGAFPGITRQSELFRDATGHGLGQVRALAAYCNFAVIYRMSPLGLDLDLPDVTPEQHAILQQLAWETVLAYPYSGMNDVDASTSHRR